MDRLLRILSIEFKSPNLAPLFLFLLLSFYGKGG